MIGLSDEGSIPAWLDQQLLLRDRKAEPFADTRCPVRLGRFEILRRLGNGTTGVVYAAHDAERGSDVALKLLGRVNPIALYRLKREFRLLSGVVHPNLVALHELCEEQGSYFVNMELIAGVSFSDWVRPPDRGGCDELRLRRALQQLAAAVSAIHAASMLHCDLKPANVLVTPDGRVVVLDFGLVRELIDADSVITRSGPFGTPGYMAPELAASSTLSAAGDWYAVGVMLFEALTGNLPFEGSPAYLIEQKQQHDAPDPRVFHDSLPADLCELCMALLRRDPTDRAGARDIEALVSEPHSVPESVTTAVPAAAIPGPSFAGRTQELDALHRAFERAASGHATAVLLSGPAGIGKTTLLDRFLADIHDRALVFRGRCHVSESAPYKVFDPVVDALSSYLSRLPEAAAQSLVPRFTAALLRQFPVMGQARLLDAASRSERRGLTDTTTRDQAFHCLKELLLRLTDRSTVVIAVDDLQWGDVDSARMLAHVLGRPEPPPLLFIGAFRSEAVDDSEFLRAACDGARQQLAHVERIELSPLSLSASQLLVRELLASEGLFPTDERVDKLATEAQGYPYLLTELVHHTKLLDDHALDRPPTAEAMSLEHMVSHRVQALEPHAKHLLEVFCVAASPIEQSVALQAAGMRQHEYRTLELLRVARLLRSSGVRPQDTAESYHDRIREIVCAHMSSDSQRAIHARLATALEACGNVDPERLFRHYVLAGDVQHAIEAARSAAQAAIQQLAFNRAADLLSQAIDLQPQCADATLLEHYAETLAQAGRGVEAAQAFLRAANASEPAKCRTLRVFAAQQYVRSGRTEQGLRLARSLLREVGVGLPETTLGKLVALLWYQIRLRVVRALGWRRAATTNIVHERLSALRLPELFFTDVLLSLLLFTRFALEATTRGDAVSELEASAWEANYQWLVGSSRAQRRATALLVHAEHLAVQIAAPYPTPMLQIANASRLLWSGRSFRAAKQAALEAQLHLARECPGALWEHAIVSHMRLVALEVVGPLHEFSDAVMQVARSAAERDDQFLGTLSMFSEVYMHLAHDSLEQAWKLLDRWRADLDSRYTPFRHMWLMRASDALLYGERGAEAVQLVLEHWRVMRRSIYGQAPYFRDSMHYTVTRAAIAAYAQTGSVSYARLARRHLARCGRSVPLFHAAVTALNAALHVGAGSKTSALAALHDAAQQLEAVGADVQSLYVRHRLSELANDDPQRNVVEQELRRQGVVNPKSWLMMTLPVARSA